MPRELIELSSTESDPAIASDRGVSLVPTADRQLHAPDRTLLLVEGESLLARCSCWWRETAMHEGHRLGVIGHYAAADAESATALLAKACEQLAAQGCTTAVGPMDGTTWRRYRFIIDRGAEPTFFLEPDNPDDWPDQWTGAGFAPLATYTSAIADDLTKTDPRTPGRRQQLADAGITIRAFDRARADVELRRIFALSLASFTRNFLYTPIGEAEFLAQNRAVLPYVRPEMVLLAERGEALAGFVFAVPDMLQARRGVPIDTLVIKTLAVDPAIGGMGLGSVLLDLVQQAALQLGFRRGIHALMHESNVSRRISGHHARTIRRYALFSRSLR